MPDKYKLIDHWKYLQTLLSSFDSKHPQALSKDAADIKAYDAARKVTDDMLAKGFKIESLSSIQHPQQLVRLGKEMDTMSEQFGEGKIPAVRGPQSLAFAQEVYLPHLIESQKIVYKAAVIGMGKTVGIDIPGKKKKSELEAAALDEKIKKYIAMNAALKSGLNNVNVASATSGPAQLKK